MQSVRPLIFVYNVDLTPFALISDFIHRIMSPATYPCRLCDLTYDRFTMKSDWKRFVATLPATCEFELRDRFRRKYPAYANVVLPAVFERAADGTLTRLLSAEQINGAATLEGLRELVTAAVQR